MRHSVEFVVVVFVVVVLVVVVVVFDIVVVVAGVLRTTVIQSTAHSTSQLKPCGVELNLVAMATGPFTWLPVATVASSVTTVTTTATLTLCIPSQSAPSARTARCLSMVKSAHLCWPLRSAVLPITET